MTINQVIAQVDARKPNAYGEVDKAGWLAELDGRLAVEVLGQAAAAYPPVRWDEPLLAPAPYDNLYPLYVEAMIDFYNQEYDGYQSAMALYNQAVDEFRKWYARANRPGRAGGFQHVL